jgi:predicted ATP-grasp superfamily ATP-dependent carboligase
VEYVDSIEGDSLIASLRAARPRLGEANPVLFLTNDRMTGSVAKRIEDVRHLYRISWHSSAAEVLRLTDKTNLAERCLNKKLHYPAERIFHRITDLLGERLELQYPLILKPSQPLSEFKTIIARKPDDIEKHQSAIARSLPVLAQEFVPGNDEQIHFVALYLNKGKPKAVFEGRKLRSRPMGHTTIAISSPCPEAREIALKFFADTDYCGPASLEMKRAPDGRLIVIEPTVGRSDFWIDVCVRNGVDLPVIEYLDQTSGEETRAHQRNLAVWINEERDPLAWIWLFLTHPGTALKRFPVFVYAHQSDLMPWWQHALGFSRRMARTASKRLFLTRSAPK